VAPKLPASAPRPPEPELGCGARILLALMALLIGLAIFMLLGPLVVPGDGSERRPP
jgi:hypothetical protein